MSWLLKQAEDILNKVDKQTNAAINQHQIKPSSKHSDGPTTHDAPSFPSSETTPASLSSINRTAAESNRRAKKNDDTDLIDYLNSSMPVTTISDRTSSSNHLLSDTTRTASSPNMLAADALKNNERFSSKSNSGTPRSTTPAAQSHDDDEGLFMVSRAWIVPLSPSDLFAP